MPRDPQGFLKRDALVTAGIPEQYATFRGGALHVVEIVHDRSSGGFIARHKTTFAGESEVTEWQCADNLRAARDHFRREVKALGGRA